MCVLACFFFFFSQPPSRCVCPVREWYVNGSYLIIIVSMCVILPLALMRHLGMSIHLYPSFSFISPYYIIHANRDSIEMFSIIILAYLCCNLRINVTLCYITFRISWLHQWFLAHMHVFLSHICESLIHSSLSFLYHS